MNIIKAIFNLLTMKEKYIGRVIIILLFTLTSCSSRVVLFKANANGKSIKYRPCIPKGYNTVTNIYENERITTFVYSDSSIIYFSNNTAPSSFYLTAYLKYGKDLNIKFCASDTIIINGMNDKGKYWEDRKIKHIVYGYRNVQSDYKEMFDKILGSIVIK